jgi:hypothetical protein
VRSKPWTCRQSAALVEVGLPERPHLNAGGRLARRPPGDQTERLLHGEAERLVEPERAHVEGVLGQADAGRRRAALDHRLHQPASDALLLDVGPDRDRPDAADRIALVKEIRTDEPPV